MEIYLMRHGIAGTRDPSAATPDEERPLTPKGIKRTHKAVKGLLTLKLSVDKLLTSPLLRARQTAEIVAGSLRIEDPMEEIPELAPLADAKELLVRLASYSECKGIFLVGHQPSLGEVASHLLIGDSGLRVNLKKSGICCIEVESLPAAEGGVLQWTLAPKQLRLLAKR